MKALLLLLFAAPAAAAPRWFPPAKEIFPPLAADPEQPAYILRMTFPVGMTRIGEAGMGDWFGLARWTTARGTDVQLGAFGGARLRFDLNVPTSDFLVGDYTGGLPFDVRFSERWSLRAMYWHTSSHLGDDYLKNTGARTVKSVTDDLRVVAALRPVRPVRLYAGYGYAMKNLPNEDKNRVQAGAEWFSRRGPWWAALDVSAAGRAKWNPGVTARAGVRAKGERGGTGVFLEYFSGRRPYLQDRREPEDHLSIGFLFEIGEVAAW